MLASLADRLERLGVAIGRAVSWLTLAMVLVTFAIVVLRYWFDAGWIWLQESVTWMHAAVFLLAAPYTLARDEHVRVDVFYARLPPRGRAAVDLAGTLVFLLPVAGFLAWSSFDYVAASWRIAEGSREAGGLGYPMPSLAKSLIPVTAGLLALQALVMAARAVLVLGGADRRRG